MIFLIKIFIQSLRSVAMPTKHVLITQANLTVIIGALKILYMLKEVKTKSWKSLEKSETKLGWYSKPTHLESGQEIHNLL